MPLTPDEIRDIVKATVAEVMTTMGMEPDDPRHMQEDFLYIRKARLGSAQIGAWIKRSVILAAVGGLLWALWEGVKMGLGK